MGERLISLPSEVAVDPADEDLFRQVIELRKSLPPGDPTVGFLKMLANSTSYGIFAEINRQESNKTKIEVEVHALDPEPFSAKVAGPKEPGRYYFPPLVAFIAGAARLMLALLERCVTNLRGTYAMGDTDSMAILAIEDGGRVPCPGAPEELGQKEAIRALSWQQVEGIRQRFARLSPYGPGKIPGSVLRLEDDNLDNDGQQHQLWCYAISAKRYCLCTPVSTVSLSW